MSHHILRLAFCPSEEQRRWFLTQECQLFKVRAEREPPEAIKAFMERYGLNFDVASAEDKVAHREALRQVWESHPPPAAEEGGEAAGFNPADDYYKVPFARVADLVRARTVLLVRGVAYVPRVRMVSALVGRFRAYLNGSLLSANAHLPKVLADAACSRHPAGPPARGRRRRRRRPRPQRRYTLHCTRRGDGGSGGTALARRVAFAKKRAYCAFSRRLPVCRVN